jgi:hypothetical protein
VAMAPFQEAFTSRSGNLICKPDKNTICSFRVMVYVKRVRVINESSVL